MVAETIAIVSRETELIEWHNGPLMANITEKPMDLCIVSIGTEMIAINSTLSEMIASFHRIVSSITAV